MIVKGRDLKLTVAHTILIPAYYRAAFYNLVGGYT